MPENGMHFQSQAGLKGEVRVIQINSVLINFIMLYSMKASKLIKFVKFSAKLCLKFKILGPVTIFLQGNHDQVEKI